MKTRATSPAISTHHWTPADPIAQIFNRGALGMYLRVWEIKDQFQDSAATVPAIVGQPVGAIRNRGTGATFFVHSGSTGTRPVLRQDSQNRLYWQFDGVDDTLSGVCQVGSETGWYSCFGMMTDTTSGNAALVDAGSYTTTASNIARPSYRVTSSTRSGTYVASGATLITTSIVSTVSGTPYLHSTSVTLPKNPIGQFTGSVFSGRYSSTDTNFASANLTQLCRYGQTTVQIGRAAGQASQYWRGRFYGGTILDTSPLSDWNIVMFLKRKIGII